jgi:hypothetical protein
LRISGNFGGRPTDAHCYTLFGAFGRQFRANYCLRSTDARCYTPFATLTAVFGRFRMLLDEIVFVMQPVDGEEPTVLGVIA